MIRILTLILMLHTGLSTHAQITDTVAARNAAYRAAKAMDEALINKHYDDYVSYNHPKVLEQVKGGAGAMTIQIAQQVKNIEESGNIITAVWPQKPTEMIDTAGEWQCTLPQFMEYRLPDGKIKAETTILGMSPDKGKTWYFIDAAGRTLNEIKELFPTLSSKLVVPAPKEPVFTADEVKK